MKTTYIIYNHNHEVVHTFTDRTKAIDYFSRYMNSEGFKSLYLVEHKVFAEWHE